LPTCSRRWSRAAFPAHLASVTTRAGIRNQRPSSCVGKLREYRPAGRGAPVKEPMSGQSTAGTLLCPRCKAAQMAEVTAIAPLLHEPGLIAYECPRCGYLTSVVQPPADPPHG
jgi:hypothetical protein